MQIQCATCEVPLELLVCRPGTSLFFLSGVSGLSGLEPIEVGPNGLANLRVQVREHVSSMGAIYQDSNR